MLVGDTSVLWGCGEDGFAWSPPRLCPKFWNLSRSETNADRGALVYVCGGGMDVRRLPDSSFTEEVNKSCRGGGGSRGKGADV